MDVSDDECSHCLPDCVTTKYDHRITSIPFRKCDLRNYGVTRFCSFENYTSPQTKLYSKRLVKRYKSFKGHTAHFVNRHHSYVLRMKPSVQRLNLRDQNKSYNAFESDIAVALIYFRARCYKTFYDRNLPNFKKS